MGVDAPEPVEPGRAEPVPSEVRDNDVFVVSNDHRDHDALAVDEQGDLPLDFKRNGTELPAQFMGDNFVAGYSSAVDFLEELQLACLEAAYLAVNLVYGSDLSWAKWIRPG
jgi:hypothetical protein